jgi:hypothetical protein
MIRQFNLRFQSRLLPLCPILLKRSRFHIQILVSLRLKKAPSNVHLGFGSDNRLCQFSCLLCSSSKGQYTLISSHNCPKSKDRNQVLQTDSCLILLFCVKMQTAKADNIHRGYNIKSDGKWHAYTSSNNRCMGLSNKNSKAKTKQDKNYQKTIEQEGTKVWFYCKV